MTVKEAKILLNTTIITDKPSKINPSLTQKQVFTIVKETIEDYEGTKKEKNSFVLPDIIKKRVYQVIRNQRKPRYE